MRFVGGVWLNILLLRIYMIKEKYILSAQYTFIQKEDIENLPVEEVQKLLKGELYALHDHQSGNILLLSPAIHKFLSFFSKPIEFEEVVKRYESLTKKPPKTIRKAIEPFLDNMFHRGIIITELWTKQKNTQKLAVGNTFGHYEVTKLLSDDANLKVCIAKDLTSENSVVLKILDKRDIPDKQERDYWLKRFKQEVTIMQEAQGHPSVCRLFEVFETDYCSVSVMEYIEGNSLRHWLENHHPVDYFKKIDLFTQVLDVYAHLHAINVLHGDIHRSNIMITEQGQVKLIDFDMAYHQPLKYKELIIEGGVQPYLPPEKISDNYFELVKGKADFVSEVYQLGVIGYFIFYEKLPFDGHTWQTLAKVIRENEAQLGDFTEGGVDAFLKKALDKKPANRFPSAMDMKMAWEKEVKVRVEV